MRWIAVWVVGLLLAACSAESARLAAPSVRVSAPRVSPMKSVLRPVALNKKVTVAGYYYDGSIPMIVDNIKRVGSGAILPLGCYVPLDGALPGGVKSGDKIKVTGRMVKPGANGPKWSAGVSAMIRIGNAKDLVVVKPSTASATEVDPGVPQIDPSALAHADSYALLIGGGYDAASCHPRWARLVTSSYYMLRRAGYPAENIIVLFTDGQKGHLAIPVDGSNQSISIDAAISNLASRMNDNATLYILVACPGGGLLAWTTCGYEKGMYGGAVDVDGDETGESYSESALGIDINNDGDKKDTLAVDETFRGWGGQLIRDDDFRVMLSKIQRYSKMIIHLDQAFGGGFVQDLTGPRRIIVASSPPTTLAPIMHSWKPWTAFSYGYITALIGRTPDLGIALNADMNRDGKVSVVEAFNLGFHNAPGVAKPSYEDNGVPPSRMLPMPARGEGALGAETAL